MSDDPRADYDEKRTAYLTARAVDRQNDRSQGPTEPDSEALAYESSARYVVGPKALVMPAIDRVLPPGRRVEATWFDADPTESAAKLAAMVLSGAIIDLEA